MKIAVYTIALNEQIETAGWAEATEGADYRAVLDTGSSDGTQESLVKLGVTVHQSFIRPWRFDIALNTAISLIPSDTDVCFRVDMDDRPRKGWREAIEQLWTEQTTAMCYTYNWSPAVRYMGDRVHRRVGFRWKGRTHERLVYEGDDAPNVPYNDTLVVDQSRRDKPRPNDLPLLESDTQEWPTDPGISLTYARELIFREKYSDALVELQRFIGLAGATGVRSAYAYRLMAYADRTRALDHLIHAEQAHSCASNYLVMAEHYLREQNWRLVYTNAQFAITLLRSDQTNRPADWGDDYRLRGPYLHEVAAIAAEHLLDYEAAYGHAVEAVRRDGSSARLIEMLRRVERKVAKGATTLDLEMQTRSQQMHVEVRPKVRTPPQRVGRALAR